MPIDTIDPAAAPTAAGVMREELADLVREAAALGLHVVLQPAADGGTPVRADLLAREVTEGGLRLKARPLGCLGNAVIDGAATLRPGDDHATLERRHENVYLVDHSKKSHDLLYRPY